jgi:hypothetical protein
MIVYIFLEIVLQYTNRPESAFSLYTFNRFDVKVTFLLRFFSLSSVKIDFINTVYRLADMAD